MILSGPEILRQVELGAIQIDPFDPKRVNPASVDLTLGDEVAVYDAVVDRTDPQDTTGKSLVVKPGMLDAAKDNSTTKFKLSTAGFILKPGIGYLTHTRETVWTNIFCPVLDGKSSVGRLFVKVHETAGYGDPNFNGQYTLEMTAVHPTMIYPGMRIAQMRFHALLGSVALYNGNYVGGAAKGPVASRAWKQLEADGIPREG